MIVGIIIGGGDHDDGAALNGPGGIDGLADTVEICGPGNALPP